MLNLVIGINIVFNGILKIYWQETTQESGLQKVIQNFIKGYITIIYTIFLELGLLWTANETCRYVDFR